MKLIKSKKANINYLAKIVDIKTFHSHSDPEVTRLKCCTVDGFNIITGVDSETGKYVYFPAQCQLNPEFLSYCNLYRHEDKNRESGKTGMFEDNGRVKAIKLRGEISEGFIIPVVQLENFITSITNQDITISDNIEFDSVEHNGKEFWVCRKYIVHTAQGNEYKRHYRKNNIARYDKVIETQFRFHYETENIKKVPQIIHPWDLIQITTKFHGTSHISARVLCKKSLKWYERIYKFFNTSYCPVIYDTLFSSRRVILNRYYSENPRCYYGSEIYELANEVIKDKLAKGMTVYAEIVGYNTNNNSIQTNYDYGYNPGKPEYGKTFGIKVYRVTLTNPDGWVHEFSAREVQQWCKHVGLEPVTELYYGIAGDLYPELNQEAKDWSLQFIEKLSNDKNFYMEELSPDCNNKVPHEGVVIRIEDGKSPAVKLKCFKFISKSQDNPDMDKEDE